MEISNAKVAKILKNVAAAYTIKGVGNFFQIRAYENAADSIENSTAEVLDLWEEGRLASIPGLGEKIRSYLEELFKTGLVLHFKEVEKGIPSIVFELLDVPGVGPKTAQKIGELEVKDLEDLKKKLKSGELVEQGFSAKIAQNILKGLMELNQRTHRMLLPYAANLASKILDYLKKSPDVLEAHPLGSLRSLDYQLAGQFESLMLEQQWLYSLPDPKFWQLVASYKNNLLLF